MLEIKSTIQFCTPMKPLLLLIVLCICVSIECKIRIGSSMLHIMINNDPHLNTADNEQMDIVSEYQVDDYSQFNSKLSKIQSKYYKEFTERAVVLPHDKLYTMQSCNQLKLLVLTECRVEMKKIMPDDAPSYWSFEDSLGDLERDIEKFIEEIHFEDGEINLSTQIEPTSRSRTINNLKAFFATKNGKRIRWLLAQSILLAVSYAQNELRQYIARRAVDRRLAEIPEFPIL